MIYSAWWGESFVNELTRISEQAQRKLKIRRGSVLDGKSSTSQASDVAPSTEGLPPSVGEPIPIRSTGPDQTVPQ